MTSGRIGIGPSVTCSSRQIATGVMVSDNRVGPSGREGEGVVGEEEEDGSI